MSDTPWPGHEQYMLAHPCPTCRASIGQPCNAPNKPRHPWHARRQDAGIRHYNRDIRNAPWPEERVPGHRYDTAGYHPPTPTPVEVYS